MRSILLKAMAVIMNNRLYISLIIVLYSLVSFQGMGQENHLQKKITIEVNNQQLQYALDAIAEEGKFNFSYHSAIIDEDSMVSFAAKRKQVEKILKDVLPSNIEFRAVGTHVILLEKHHTVAASTKVAEYVITGFIIDARTGEKIAEATVYEAGGQNITNTNHNGFFELTVPANKQVHGLNFSKRGYLDTVIMVQPRKAQRVEVQLKSRYKNMDKMNVRQADMGASNIDEMKVVKWMVPQETRVSSNNLRLFEGKAVQFSVVPFVGSNQLLSGSTTNNLSFNLFAGYSGGLDGFEMGTFLNIIRYDMKGVQLSGFGSIVGEKTNGVQMAGYFNVNFGSVRGAQFSGFANVAKDSLTGAQVAGFNNTLMGKMDGVQLAGFNNLTTQNVDGLQAAGFLNVAFKDVELAQVAGFANFARDVNFLQGAGFVNLAYGNVEALQLSGFGNYARDVNGVQGTGFVNLANGDVNYAQLAGFGNAAFNVNGLQASGFFNLALGDVKTAQLTGFVNAAKNVGKVQMTGFCNFALDSVGKAQVAGYSNFSRVNNGLQLAGFANVALLQSSGTQLAGFFNYTTRLDGRQIAVFNIADTVISGGPIGFLSFVRRGFHELELTADEVFYSNLTFRMGTEKFQNILKGGIGRENTLYSAYGLGSRANINEKHNLTFDLYFSTVIDGANRLKYLGSGVKFEVLYGFNFSKLAAFTIGPSVSFFGTPLDANGQAKKNIALFPFYEQDIMDFRIQGWAGLTAGFRF